MNPSVSVQPINNSFLVRVVSEEYQAPAKVDPLVTEIWKAATAADSKLFDGKIVCVDSVNADSLQCKLIPYRYIWAQRQTPELKSQLRLRPLGVSGLTHNDKYVLFGLRNNQVMQYPGFLETVPSGGVSDSVLAPDGIADYCRQLQNELLEEAGVSATSLLSITPLFLLYDELETTYDICCQIVVDPEALDHLPHEVDKEYEQLLPVELTQLSKFIAANKSRIMPTSLKFLEQQQLFALN